jgi:GNAT superfamily N-acetyltransferase
LALDLRRFAVDGKVGSEAARDGEFAGRLVAILGESDVRGRHAWSGLDDHGIAAGEDPSLYRELYGVAAETWVDAGYLDHYVVVPAADDVLAAWYSLSFAQQQVHGRRILRQEAAPEPEGFTLRIGGPEDIDLAMELAFVIFDHQASAPTWAGAPAPPEEEARASYADYLAEDGVAYFVAERGGEPLGHLILERTGQDETELTIAATVPAARGLGVGTALARYALAWAWEQGYRACITDWRSANLLAGRFWPSMGFEPTAYRLFRSIVLTPR